MEYDLTQQPIRITVPPDIAEHIVDYAHIVRDNYAEKGVGWEATYRYHKNAIMPTSIMGYLGEWATARVLGLDFRTELFDNGDPGWDNEINGLRIQMKCGSGKHLIFHTLSHFKAGADVATFAEFLGDRREPHLNPTFDVWGWCSHKDFDTHHRWRVFGDTKPNAYLHCSELRPMATLLTARKPEDHARLGRPEVVLPRSVPLLHHPLSRQ